MSETQLLQDEWRVGPPLNGSLWHGAPYCVAIPRPCPPEGLDFSGKDPRYQWLADWHGNCGYREQGNNDPQSPKFTMGGYHIEPDSFNAQMYRAELIAGHDGKQRIGVRLRTGSPAFVGGAAVTRPFNVSIPWTPGAKVRCDAWMLPKAQSAPTLYENFEIRSLNEVQTRGEAWETVRVALWGRPNGDAIEVVYWDNPYTDARIGTMLHAEVPEPIRRDRWNHLRVRLVGAVTENCWNLVVKWNGGVIYRSGKKPIRGVRTLTGIMFGNEHASAKNGRRGNAGDNGGEWLWSFVSAVLVLSDDGEDAAEENG